MNTLETPGRGFFSSHLSLFNMNEQVNDLIELITRKYMHTHVKAALQYLMDEIGIGSGTEIRQVLKVTAELKIQLHRYLMFH